MSAEEQPSSGDDSLNRPMKMDSMSIDASLFREIIRKLRRGVHVPVEMREEAANELFMEQTPHQKKQARHYRLDHS